ncbi:hypothetical protein, partial [uncultured Roseibium sp.]|uniref:hypothetical protein n=1 Tax=uncultured Roseibium sp. TaxID=1936171 RepID=UPI00260809A9
QQFWGNACSVGDHDVPEQGGPQMPLTLGWWFKVHQRRLSGRSANPLRLRECLLDLDAGREVLHLGMLTFEA